MSPESYDELFKVHSYVDAFNGIDVDYTLGFFNPRLPFTNLYMHGGNNYGFTSYFSIDPDKGWGFVLFTNSEYGEQLGGELTLTMLTGPDHTRLFLLLGSILLLLLLGLFFIIRFVIRRFRKSYGW